MDAKTLLLLQSADDPECCEYPVGFDLRAELARVEDVAAELEVIVGEPLEVDRDVQDASFFGEVSLRRPSRKPGYIAKVIAVQFSSFGHLFTVWSSCSEDELLPTPTVAAIITAVERHGYHYVDDRSLEEPYCGPNPAFAGQTWGYRFFEYL